MSNPMSDSIPVLFLKAGLPDIQEAAEFLQVNRTTIKRWRNETTPAPRMLIHLLHMMAGNPPGMAKQQWFNGWKFNGDLFISPEGDKYTEGDIRSFHFMQSELTGLRVALRKANEQNAALQKQIDDMEKPAALPDNVVQFPGTRRRADSA